MLESVPSRRLHLVVISVAVVLSVAIAGGASARGGSAPVRLLPDGIGSVHFGVAQAKAVVGLRALFGAPSAHGINTGCGERYTEVVWGELAAEFRSGRFSGFRYIQGGYPLTTAGSPRAPSPVKHGFPRVATVKGITLGSTLGQLRRAYRLRLIGASRWQAPNGLVFVDNAKRDPEPVRSRIVEIKIATCGDF
jgi:hypothetical protein